MCASPDCHAEVDKVRAGLCDRCYVRQWREQNPEKREAQKRKARIRQSRDYQEKQWQRQHGAVQRLLRLWGIVGKD